MSHEPSAPLAACKGHSQDLTLLYDVAAAMSQSLELEPILETALDIVVDRLDMAAGTIFLYDEDQQRFVARAHRGLTPAQQAEIERFRCEVDDFVAYVAANRQMLYEPEASATGLHKGLFDDPEARSTAVLPLVARGRFVGAIGITSKPGRQFNIEGAQTLLAVGHEIGIAIENALLIAEIRRSEQEARTLYEIGIDISASLELDRVVQVVAEGARRALAADIGVVAFLDSEAQELVLRAVAGSTAGARPGARLPIRAGERMAALSRGEPIIDDHCLLAGPEGLAEPAPYALVIAPLLRAGQLLGVVGVLSRARRHFGQREAQLLVRLASQVTVAIENAQLYQQVRHMAALEERDRLARELHDSLAQTLSALGMQASLVAELLASGQIEPALTALHDLRSAGDAAYNDVREAIFNLRTTMPSGLGLLATLRAYLEEYRTHSGLDTDLVVDDESLAELPAETAAQVIRIVQEALTNVRKHARASRVRLRFARDADAVITVEDDGIGFDMSQVSTAAHRCFGLQVMRERAERVGAALAISSQPGCGTQVTIRFPRAGEESDNETATRLAGR